ncbi:tryptophan ABC transporter substrate-binding protein [Mobiluncus sp.]|uniref:tryptophan ABC transporter substrate-binding protein n=1 Tax=Mobiluncus sp. TaxID=47293 RepID=UPI002A90A87B|nr:tryptophan ABC transporter substrate-binding protein [Mobiluncus sp.]MDY6077473.1 tryptophan ABC transporter substrate-binding protein [Mobiluncus sp.]
MNKIAGIGAFLVGSLITLFICMPFMLSARDCTTPGAAAANNAAGASSGATANTKVIEVGLLQLMSHPSLDDIRQGIYDGLAERGYTDGENIRIEYENGQGDQTLLKTISDQFMADKKDYLVGIATPAAQALANSSQDSVPVVISAVSDPVGVGLVKDNKAPGVNVTGTSDQAPVKAQLDLVKQIMPDAKRLGILYSSSSQNVGESVAEAKRLAPEYGWSAVEATITTTNDLAQVAEQLAGDVDMIFVPNDNVIASAMPTLIAATDSRGVPVFPVVDAMVQEGGLATVGINQHQLGVDTGYILADLIEGKKAAEYPIKFTDKVDTIVNLVKAKALGITIPADLAASAKDVSAN